MPEKISLSIRSLAEFTCRTGSIDSRFTGLERAQQGAIIHRRLQRQSRQREGAKAYKAEVSLKISIEHDNICYALSGRADGILRKKDIVCIEEIKTTAENVAEIDMQTHPEHLAQALCYGHILCQKEKLDNIRVRLIYFNIDSEDINTIEENFTAKQAEEAVFSMLAAYSRFAKRQLEWHGLRSSSLQGLRFPFGEYRKGQRSMAIGVYNSCKNAEKLFCCAPTGTGKTVSALFPAMKAVGEGFGERIFYLTAKGTSRKTAEDGLAMLCAENNFAFMSISLTAKDKICFLEERACLPEMCEFANGYYNRLNDALYEVLQNETAVSQEIVEAYAKKHKICPHEFSLDISLWCDCIVCDYNYVFDPVVYLRRFFEGGGGENIFLIDEAHNLLERGRDMYSSALFKSSFVSLKKALPPTHKKLHRALTNINSLFVKYGKLCKEEDTKLICQADIPEGFGAAVEKFVAEAAAYLENNKGSEIENDLLALFFEAGFWQKIEMLYGENYICLIEGGRDVCVRLVCLDPADFLHQSLNLARSSVLFSATLLPLPYYRRVLGGLAPNEKEKTEEENSEENAEDENTEGNVNNEKPADAKSKKALLLRLESPFKPENLGIYIAEGISTKYTDREHSLAALCDMLYQMTAAKTGNYIAYFPSYSYMENAHELFCSKYPALKTYTQKSGMSEDEREEFLELFCEQEEESMLAFCVMGGVFAEGVDLAGQRLIGTAVVGVGLPQIGPVPNSIRDYYNNKNMDGFDFAYRYPGMNKVLQAAGRVIRGETDKGVLLLIDSRFATSAYTALYPPHWRHAQICSAQSLPQQLENFWQNNK